MDTRDFGFDTGWFKTRPPKYLAMEHNFDRLDLWRGTDKEAKFALIEFSDGIWNDPYVSWYIKECDRKNLVWGSWHFLLKNIIGVDPKNAVREQVKTWLKTPRSPFFPRQVDYEFSRKYKNIPSASQLLEACNRIEDKEGRPCIIYTRYKLVNTGLATMTTVDLNKRWWWLAQYRLNQMIMGEHRGPPTTPNRVRQDRIIIHQTADHLAPPLGFTPNAKSMDYDRWCGVMSLQEFTHTMATQPNG